MKKIYLYSFAFLLSATTVISCKSNKNATSEKTGLAYNRAENGGFQVNTKFRRGPGPGLVEIEGGVFVMSGSAIGIPGQELKDYNHKRETTVSSFYMDETEVSNTNWLEYLNWIRRVDPTNYEYYYNELPDTLVWRRPLSYNEPYVDNYLRHPAYQDYPVVGVSWEQAQRYCSWRTDIVNESLLREQGYMSSYKDMYSAQSGKKGSTATMTPRPTGPFTTDLYQNGQYDDKGKRAMKDLSPQGALAADGKPVKGGATRNVRLEDGILKQPYRLPTEAEWEYAALGLIGNTEYENINNNKIYPWDGLGIASAKSKTRGLILANFKRTKGDYMGVGGSLNDKGSITVPVRAYVPNDFGLYNMAGNVNEWVSDVYRSNTFGDAEALNPYRGNNFQDKKIADQVTGKLEKDKYNRPIMTPAVSGRKQTWAEKQAAVAANTADPQANPTNGTTYMADQRGYRDEENKLYGEITLVNNKSRVYKGGSWDDQALWLNPATRRYLQQDESTADIGFRCAMTMLGASEINPGGKPQFKPKQQKPFNAKKR
ncbi:SUMF1/EgtB/PvdO family nonheme iron enzyme [Pedobacter sp. MC2016-15]|uniref:SUMF1/EgtB/PvdO family nonheme iron enzyme n=1 Tax=Pedobacter sp. MC2016-15 TaxID=2994473 RepID=UPI002247E940|nr:SUMF1/EgtB/PvdO family nonheme iron enzyme [Pedobacter sp. MC2016-15]MCX2481712.1 SUMF1/EgtB/PvdO family nonheme iron enzyme [Pedobacter sp. MC2016-15]